MAEALLVAAREERRAPRAAHRAGYIAVGELRAGGGKRVDVRRDDIFAAEAGDIAAAQIISQDDEEVRPR